MNPISAKTTVFGLSNGEEIMTFDTIPACDGQTDMSALATPPLA